ncbi:MAG TPA: 4-vinyl reductase [Dyella sp.]|uniref:4-vinyl reductase n=1 Tax=Dyella sp. TaxID=1869338 RepID=UPI002F9506AA
MIDVEFKITAERREGLLVELGRIVINCGYTLLRPRTATSGEGVLVTLAVRGPERNLSALSEQLSTHPLAQSFESAVLGGKASAPQVNAAQKPRPAARPDEAYAREVEALLPELARHFPKVLPLVVGFEREISPEYLDEASRYAGTRLGAWMFKRDYSLGARLNLADSVKQIALPAMRSLRSCELVDGKLIVKDSPFCGNGLHHGKSCHFLRGCLEGLLNEPGHLGSFDVEEAACRNLGAARCIFTFTPVD